MKKIEQRLLQLKTSLVGQDHEMAQAQLALLKVFDEEVITRIIEYVEEQAFDEALVLIDVFLDVPNTELVEYQDTELEALRLQLKELEQVVEALSEQQAEQVFLLNEFNTQLSLATGEIVQEILQFRKQIEQERLWQKQEKLQEAKQALEEEKSALDTLKHRREQLEEALESLDEFELEFEELEDALAEINEDIRQQQETVRKKRQTFKEQEAVFEDASEESVKEAEEEFEAFEESYQEAKDDKVASLNDEDKGLLKKLYRKAAKLCHPDTAANEMKDQATEMMKQLNDARDAGDIQAIQLLLEKLEKGTAFILASDMLTDRVQLEEKISELLAKLERISNEMEEIHKSETWQLVESLESWDSYFKEQQSTLYDYLEQVRMEYEGLISTKQPQHAPASAASMVSSTKTDNYWEEDF